MPIAVRQLSASDAGVIASLWQSATDRRRVDLGLTTVSQPSLALERPGAFGVAAVDGLTVLAMAVAMPARADDSRSVNNVPGLAHISSVATVPERWGEGLGRRCMEAIMCQAVRRGYARVQLWTHDSNAGAQRLYQHAGFELSGRRKVDDAGETIVHYLRELPTLPWVSRPASRLVCLDPQGRVLLMHWRDPLDGYQLWEPPGGGVEAGESPYDAVVWEWQEETGLPLPRMSEQPTLVAREVIFNGCRSVVDEAFFLGRAAAAGEVRPDEATEAEQDALLGYAWVPVSELPDLEDPVEPDLGPVLDRLRTVSTG